jgi:hypothetical protein
MPPASMTRSWPLRSVSPRSTSKLKPRRSSSGVSAASSWYSRTYSTSVDPWFCSVQPPRSAFSDPHSISGMPRSCCFGAAPCLRLPASLLCPLGATAEAGCWKPAHHRRMRLYRCRLDMRACHPASNIGRPSLMSGVSTPHFPAFTGSPGRLLDSAREASPNCSGITNKGLDFATAGSVSGRAKPGAEPGNRPAGRAPCGASGGAAILPHQPGEHP